MLEGGVKIFAAAVLISGDNKSTNIRKSRFSGRLSKCQLAAAKISIYVSI